MGKIIAYSMDHLMNSPDEEIRLKAIKLENQLYDYAGYVATLELEFKRIFDLKDNYGVNWYQSEFKKLDRKRREHHDDAIRALCALNRMCMAEALPLFYSGNPVEDDRGDVADAIFKYYSEKGYRNFG